MSIFYVSIMSFFNFLVFGLTPMLAIFSYASMSEVGRQYEVIYRIAFVTGVFISPVIVVCLFTYTIYTYNQENGVVTHIMLWAPMLVFAANFVLIYIVSELPVNKSTTDVIRIEGSYACQLSINDISKSGREFKILIAVSIENLKESDLNMDPYLE